MTTEDHKFEIPGEIRLHPVGVIRNSIKEQMIKSDANGIELQERLKQVREKLKIIRNMISELIIDPSLEGILDGIEEYSHIFVLYWAHEIPHESRKLKKVHPMGRKDIPLKGIFATCSPARPNPILLTAVKLIERNGNILKVQGLEAIDGSPVIDVKPYVQSYHAAENPKVPEWIEKIHKELEYRLPDK